MKNEPDKSQIDEFLTVLKEGDFEAVKQQVAKNPSLLKLEIGIKKVGNKKGEARFDLLSKEIDPLHPIVGKMPIAPSQFKQINMLMAAVSWGHKDLAEYFLKKEVPLEIENGLSALELAAEENNQEMVDLLFQKSSAGAVRRAIFKAVSNKNFKLAFHLEDKNKPISLSFWDLFVARRYGFSGIKKIITRRILKQGVRLQDVLKKSERKLVIEAIKKDDVELLKWLKEKGIDILNANRKKHLFDMEPLSVAVIMGHEKTASFLIEEGASVNNRNHLGLTPLHLAAKFNLTKMAKLLLQNGAYEDVVSCSVNGEESSFKSGFLEKTPLMTASVFRSKEVADILVNSGADIDYRNRKGQTALMLAVLNGQKEMVEFLIEKGASLEIRDNNYDTALMLAKRGKNKEIVSILDSCKSETIIPIVINNQKILLKKSNEYVKE